MPELPEVETIVREIRPGVVGKQISEIISYWPKTFQNNCPAELAGQLVERIDRKGKYLRLSLNISELVIHLRMTGQLLLKAEAGADQDRHIRATIRFSDGQRLDFKDTRKFGRIYHVLDANEILDRVGMDALDQRLDAHVFYQLLSGKKSNIKAFFLSQKYISGLGNIYVDEMLFKSGIHPASVTAALSRRKANQLYGTMKDVLQFAVSNMGSTISDYRDAYGELGSNQNYFTVYGRTGQPCVKCGQSISKMRWAGRGTHYCRHCQKIYK